MLRPEAPAALVQLEVKQVKRAVLRPEPPAALVKLEVKRVKLVELRPEAPAALGEVKLAVVLAVNVLLVVNVLVQPGATAVVKSSFSRCEHPHRIPSSPP